MFSLSTAEIRQRLKNKTKDNGCNITRFLKILAFVSNSKFGTWREKKRQISSISQSVTRHCDRPKFGDQTKNLQNI
jgi:hypothetical protein